MDSTSFSHGRTGDAPEVTTIALHGSYTESETAGHEHNHEHGHSHGHDNEREKGHDHGHEHQSIRSFVPVDYMPAPAHGFRRVLFIESAGM